jgi:hypothetical protein
MNVRRTRVRRPRSDEELWPGTDYPHSRGDIGAIEHPWEWGSDEAERMAQELADKIAKKKPMGFQAEWE